VLAAVSLLLLAAPAVALQALPGRAGAATFSESPFFGERVAELHPGDGVRLVVNLPGVPVAGSPWQVVFFATPNGSTIEQTLGCRAAPGVDWRHDVQHVAAQVRALRAFAPQANVALLCAEAEGLSWPAWRARHGGGGAGVRAIVARALAALPARDADVALCAHSGGGSFLWAFIEDGGEIPAYVQRLVFLDANYSFDADAHAGKLRGWLRGAPQRRLVVIAYDDREVVFQGKKVVGPTGGTFRASQRMREALAAELAFATSRQGDLERSTDPACRCTVVLHLNPAARILHTALVGEMNGLLYALTLGEGAQVPAFGPPRAYERWIQPRPGSGIETIPASSEASPGHAAPARGEVATTRPLPPRAAGARGGRDVLREVAALPLREREVRLVAEIAAGNVPPFLRKLVPVTITREGRDGVRRQVLYHVTPDYLAVGSDRDFARVPLTPAAAQEIADRHGFALPTRLMVAQIHARAELQLEPRPLGEPRQAVTTFLAHDDLIEAQRAGQRLGLLVSGIKKDVVVTPGLVAQPDRVAIFGWFRPDGDPIQPLYLGHRATYVDYSHGVRLVSPTVEVDGERIPLADVLADPVLHALLSDEGMLARDAQRYRTRR